jgi:hypothetical protein
MVGLVQVLADLPAATAASKVSPSADIWHQHRELFHQRQRCLFVISPNGKIVRQVTIKPSSPHIAQARF